MKNGWARPNVYNYQLFRLAQHYNSPILVYFLKEETKIRLIVAETKSEM